MKKNKIQKLKLKMNKKNKSKKLKLRRNKDRKQILIMNKKKNRNLIFLKMMKMIQELQIITICEIS